MRFILFAVAAFAAAVLLALLPVAGRAAGPQDGAVIQSGSGVLEPVPGHSILLAQEPRLSAEEQAALDKARQQIDEARSLTLVPIAPNAVYPDTPANGPSIAQVLMEGAKPSAPGDIAIFRDTVPRNGGDSHPHEPTAANNGRLVFETGNTYARLSQDHGQTWSAVTDPLPAPAAPYSSTVCCDQVAYYERTRDLMVWYLQYRQNASGNVVRLAVAHGLRRLQNLAWTVYDFAPQGFGYAAGFWFDYPDLATSDNFLYFTTNIFPASGGSVGSLIVRIPLNQLAAGGTINYNFIVTTGNSSKLTTGAAAIMYWATHQDTDTIRVWSWPENSGTVTEVTRDVTAWERATRSSAPSPDGTNWGQGNFKHDIVAAWVEDTRIGFMWSSSQSAGNPPSPYPWPNVRYVRLNTSNLNVADQGVIWNAAYAFAYPSAHVNNRGDIGGTVSVGGGQATNNPFLYPSMAVWLADDFNNRTVAPLTSLVMAIGTNGPLALAGTGTPPTCRGGFAPPCYRWGDYFSTRRHSMYGNTWIGTAYIKDGGQDAGNDRPHYVWFGRERDRPPANNTIWVSNVATGWQNGTFFNPYHTVDGGNFATVPGDTVIINAGVYNERVTLDRPSLIVTLGGPVTIVGQ